MEYGVWSMEYGVSVESAGVVGEMCPPTSSNEIHASKYIVNRRQ